MPEKLTTTEKNRQAAETYEPMEGRLLVRRQAKQGRTESGILLPDSAQKKQTRGQVLALGEGLRRSDGTRDVMPVEVGDTVLFGEWSGSTLPEDETLVILHVNDLLARVE